MKPFVKRVPPGGSGVGSGSHPEPFFFSSFKRRFWVFFEVLFPLPPAKRLDAGLHPRGNLGLQASIDANVA
jgi:hypothetical protein